MKQKEPQKKQPGNKRKTVERNGEQQKLAAVEKNKGIKSGNGKYTIHLISIAIILITGIIVYSNSFDCSFHFDDNNIFSLSRGLDGLSDWINLFPARPVGMITFFINYSFNKLDVWGYHLVNLTIHLVNAILVWWLTFLTFTTPAMKGEGISRHKMVIAFLTGLLFITHPLATQSVTYIIQRFASLATMFYLLSLVLYINGRLRPVNEIKSYILYGASIMSAILGMLSKEIAFTLPLAVILYEIFFLMTGSWRTELRKSLMPVFLIMLGFFVIIFFRNNSLDVFNRVPPGQGYNYSISAKEYLFTQFSVITTYIRLFFLPLNLTLDYDYPVSRSLFEMKTLLSLALLSGIMAAGVLTFRRYRLIAFGVFWFFLTLSVESSILPISQNVIFEHRTYLPGFGFFLVLAVTPFYFINEKYFRIAVAGLLVIAAINAVLTYQRNYIWKDDYTLWTDGLKKSPNKARTWYNVGRTLSRMNKYREAIPYLDQAIVLNPIYAEVYFVRAATKEKMQDYAGAIADYNTTIELAKTDADTYYNLDICFSQLGTIYGILGKTNEAIRSFRKALSYNPNLEKAHYNLGVILLGKNQTDEALEHFRQSVRINPQKEKVRLISGSILVRRGNVQEAVALFKEEILIRPDNVDAYNDLGSAYFLQGKPEKSVACYQKALLLDAKNLMASKNLKIAQKKLGSTGKTDSCP